MFDEEVEERFIKSYPQFCCNGKPLSPFWDLWQAGAEFGHNQCKDIEQIRNERNLFQEKCEDIELNYYCDKLECRFLSRNKWHYVKDGDLPTDKTEKKYLVALKSEYGGFFYETDIWCESLHCFASNNPTKIYAWKEIVLPKPPKYWDLSTGENNINKESE